MKTENTTIRKNEFDEEAWNDLAARGFAGTEK